MQTELRIAIARLETIRNTSDNLMAELCETIIDLAKIIMKEKEEIGFHHDRTEKK
jgi:hypothetical protein